MKNKLKKLPAFKNEEEESNFWATHSPLDYLDHSKTIVVRAVPNLKPSTEFLSMRLSSIMLAQLKTVANRKDLGYSSLAKVYIEKGIKEDLKGAA